MAKFDEIPKAEWDYMRAKYGYEVKSELPTNTYTDVYVNFNIDEYKQLGRIRKYLTGSGERYYLWR